MEMLIEPKWTWFDGLLKRSGIPYPIVSLSIGFMIYFIFLFLGRMLDIEWELDEKIRFILVGFMVAYQLSVMQYLLDEYKKIMSYLSILSPSVEGNFFWKLRAGLPVLSGITFC